MVSFQDLRNLQKKERESAFLVPLPEDFYDQVSLYLKELKEKGIKNHNLLLLQEYENAKRVVRSIMERREEKIVLFAIRGVEINGITEDEKRFLEAIKKALAERAKVREELIADENNGGERQLKTKKVRFTVSVPAYRGADGKIYGPYEKGEVLDLPVSEAEILLKNKMVEYLE